MNLPREILRLLAMVNGRGRADVSLAALSGLAHRSRFSLHRWFTAVVGETPKGYTSRVRLARAAAELVATDRLISVIADRHGYASHEVFTRAFTRQFGLSPSRYRARGAGAEDDRAIRIHAATVTSVAPCIGLYRRDSLEGSMYVPVDVAVKDLPPVHALVMRRRIARDEIATTLAECLPALFGYAVQHGLAVSGPPFARYPEIGMGSLVIEGGVQLAAPAPSTLDDGIEALTIPGGPAAMAIHYGPYEQLIDTYRAVENWIKDEGRSPGGPPWEIYLTDPGERPDPQTWETQIIQPLA